MLMPRLRNSRILVELHAKSVRGHYIKEVLTHETSF